MFKVVYMKPEYNIINLSDLINSYPELDDFINGTDDIAKIFDFKVNIDPERKNKYKRIYEGIGNTCVYNVRLNNNNLLKIKMEYTNPMGNSHYSRFWIPYLYISEILGKIKPNDTILEITSGNSGLALAMAAKELNFKLKILVPEILPAKRIEPMEHFGAEIIKTKGYVKECIYRLRKELVKHKEYVITNHSEEKSDFIIKIMKRIGHEYFTKNGIPDYILSGIGNGTSTLALYDYFGNKQKKPKYIGYYPKTDEKAITFGLYKNNTPLRHVPVAIEKSDRIFSNEIFNIDKIREIFKYDSEIYNLGHSTLYGIAIAMHLAEEVRNQTFLLIGYDKNDRY